MAHLLILSLFEPEDTPNIIHGHTRYSIWDTNSDDPKLGLEFYCRLHDTFISDH